MDVGAIVTVDLRLGDCLEILPTLAAGSVDAIITDLPYGTTACAWDEVIPFEPMWAEVKRLLRPRGVFVTTASQPFTSKLVMSNLDWFRYEWIWDKRMISGILNANKMPLKRHENICVFSPNGHNYYPQFGKAGKPFGRMSESHDTAFGDVSVNNRRGVGYPKSILSYPIPNNVTGDKWNHPTQKPVALYEYLILTYTNIGDLVLDISAGSGTTGIAAIKTGRNAILIEKEPGYYEIAKCRIEQAQMQMVMPL